MVRHGHLVLVQAIAIVTLAPACVRSGYGPEDNPTTVRDVTGVQFGWSCTSSECEIARLRPRPRLPDACAGSDTPN